MITFAFPFVPHKMLAQVPQVYNVHQRKNTNSPSGGLDRGSRHREIIWSPQQSQQATVAFGPASPRSSLEQDHL